MQCCCCCAGAGKAVLLFKQGGFLTHEELDIDAEGLGLFQELLQWLFLGMGRQKGVSAGNSLLQVHK